MALKVHNCEYIQITLKMEDFKNYFVNITARKTQIFIKFLVECHRILMAGKNLKGIAHTRSYVD